MSSYAYFFGCIIPNRYPGIEYAVRWVCGKEGFDRHSAFAMSALGILAYRENDLDLAESRCLQSNQIARPREYFALIFQNCYYLWRIALSRNDQASATSNERTLRAYLSRVEEHLPEAVAYRDHLTGGEK